MGTQAKTVGGKLIKFVLLCAVIYLLLYGFQQVIDFLYVQVDMKKPWWRLHVEWWSKYPLFAVIGYMIYSEKI